MATSEQQTRMKQTGHAQYCDALPPSLRSPIESVIGRLVASLHVFSCLPRREYAGPRCDFCSKSISQEDKRCKLSCGCVTCVGCLLKKHSLRGARQLVCPKCKCVVNSHRMFDGIDDAGSNVVYPQGDMHPIDKLQISS